MTPKNVDEIQEGWLIKTNNGRKQFAIILITERRGNAYSWVDASDTSGRLDFDFHDTLRGVPFGVEQRWKRIA